MGAREENSKETVVDGHRNSGERCKKKEGKDMSWTWIVVFIYACVCACICVCVCGECLIDRWDSLLFVDVRLKVEDNVK